MSIPKTFIDQVLDQTDIVEVVGRRVPINKKGANYWGVCPFHDDHKPSMAVNQDKQFYYCFVCQASGNSINFLREYENLDFTDVLKGEEPPKEVHESANPADVSFTALYRFFSYRAKSKLP